MSTIENFDVACLGILVADVLVKPADTIPGAGLLERVERVGLYSGGCAMSASIDMAKLGLRTAILGKVGDDIFGGFLRSELQKYGVDAGGLTADETVQTSASVCLVSGGGERSFLHCVGANGSFCYDDADFGVISRSKIAFFAGTMLMDSFDGEPCARALKKAKELGKVTALDTAWDSKGRWMSVLGPCLPHIDYFLPSADEAAALSGKSDLNEMADFFFEHGVKHVAIKKGSLGCYLRESKNSPGIIVPAYKRAARVLDTTGAGDAFCAGFLTGLVKGLDFIECGKLANAVGAHCVAADGATAGIKSYEETRQFMEGCERVTN